MGLSLLTKVLEEITSPANARIKVVKSLGLGTYIQVDGITQSGGIVEGIWKKGLKPLTRSKPETCLILGLGGGTAAKLVQAHWPKAKITGVDIDPVMVEMGRKYLGLKGTKVVISDASDFLGKDNSAHYDLILVDLYLGYEFPLQFEKESFLGKVKKSLSPNGVAVFNRLYMAEKRSMAVKFGLKLEKVFPRVTRVYPEANVMFLCFS